MDHRKLTFSPKLFIAGQEETKNLRRRRGYPLAVPLASFVSETEEVRQQKRGREFIEAALAMAAYLAYLEFCTDERRFKSGLFKAFTHRSAGPLLALLRESLDKLPKMPGIALPYRELVSPELSGFINDAVDFIADEKHDKARSSAFDIRKPVQILANISQRVFRQNIFGVFEDVKKPAFASHFQGFFRQATGRPPFVQRWLYKGAVSFGDQEPYLVNVEKGTALALAPLPA